MPLDHMLERAFTCIIRHNFRLHAVNSELWGIRHDLLHRDHPLYQQHQEELSITEREAPISEVPLYTHLLVYYKSCIHCEVEAHLTFTAQPIDDYLSDVWGYAVLWVTFDLFLSLVPRFHQFTQPSGLFPLSP